MGLLDIINRNISEDITNNLTKEELEFLLVSLKKTTFTGEYLEMLFNIVIKLQNQYQKYN
jgi:hypothetical protein